MKPALGLARSRPVLLRALKVALVVGTLLTLINQGDRIVEGLAPDLVKMALSYLVPFCVSVHGAVSATRQNRRGGSAGDG